MGRGCGHVFVQLFLEEGHLLIALLAIKIGKSQSALQTFILLAETSYFFLQVEGASAPDHIIP
jgi:hypothetical protein